MHTHPPRSESVVSMRRAAHAASQRCHFREGQSPVGLSGCLWQALAGTASDAKAPNRDLELHSIQMVFNCSPRAALAKDMRPR